MKIGLIEIIESASGLFRHLGELIPNGTGDQAGHR